MLKYQSISNESNPLFKPAFTSNSNKDLNRNSEAYPIENEYRAENGTLSQISRTAENYPNVECMVDSCSVSTENASQKSFLQMGHILLSILLFVTSGAFTLGFYAGSKYSQGDTSISVTAITSNDLSEALLHDSPPRSTSTSNSDELYNIEKRIQESILSFSFSSQSPAPRPLLYLNHLETYQLLLDGMSPNTMQTFSSYSSDFFLISSGLDAQINQAYCGVATAVAIINSLRFLKSSNPGMGGPARPVVDIPIDPVYAPYHYATQNDIFNNCTQNKVISHTGGGRGVDGILSAPYGLSMSQITDLLSCELDADNTNDWTIKSQYVDITHLTLGKMRFDIKNALSDPNSRVMVNYDRGTVGQIGGGHWSPVGSYSERSDAFLILDVAKYKYPPVWIPSETLYDSMATVDECGYWNYPSAQDDLSLKERTPRSIKEYEAVKEMVGCEKRLRGYIIVTKN